jgi:NifU-like protein involved in Fe-S cluster formation
MQIDLQLEGDLIRDARYMTDGCGPSIASAGMATRLAKGKTVAEAQKITQDDILHHLGNLPDDHRHCAKLAALTLQRAIQNIGQVPGKLEEGT